MKRGTDWHAWAWKPMGEWPNRKLFWFAEGTKPDRRATESGRWVRVKFVEVKPKRKAKK